MNTPTYNAEGMQVYKPQPGEYWKHGLRFRESYGGIIAEINDIIEKGGNVSKTYPQNFAGIIAALNDLGQLITQGELPNIGDLPPGWDIIYDPITNLPIDGDWQEKPLDGTLWFDTRQGRLFIAKDGEYWQTNGGDGLAHVGDSQPTAPPVIGSTWFDSANDLLYVCVQIEDPDNPGQNILAWQVVKGAGEVTLTTATLPLAISRSTFSLYSPTVIPDVPVDQMGVQKDFNAYIYSAAVALDKAVTENTVTISDTPPVDNVVNGTLWYDSTTLELSVWYEDDDSGQWVPTSVNYSYDDDLSIIRSSVVAETSAREYAISEVLTQINALREAGIPDVDALETKVAALEEHVNNHPVEVDLTGYVTEAMLDPTIESLANQINVVNSRIPNLTPYATTNAVDAITSAINELPTKSYVTTAIAASQPDLSVYVEQSDIDTSIAGITTEYLPRTGGVLTGSFQLQKNDYALPSLDFSGASWYSKCAFKFTANALEEAITKFGTTDKRWEYAWEFGADEDFCWIYNDSNKVFSITKEGPACSTLYLGDIDSNTNNGRIIHNKIDVKERLNTYQSAFENIRQAVSSSTDYESLKSGLLTALATV